MSSKLPDTESCLVIEWFPIAPEDNDGYHWRADYYLRLPVAQYDFRNDGSGFIKIPISQTRSGMDHSPITDGEVDTPFRDGVHIVRDARLLRLKAYARYGDLVTELDTREHRRR